MLVFACPACERLVTFESTVCLHCHTELGFDPRRSVMSALVSGVCRCANADVCGCNWVARSKGDLCASCVLTRTRPRDSDEQGFSALASVESARRRLLFELADLGLPIDGWREVKGGLALDFLSSAVEPVTTGHAGGVITLDLDEADPVQREDMRVRLGEPYRTVLGHLRHEVGHYYQPILVGRATPDEAECRRVFGDERESYQEAMDRYYEAGAPAAWQNGFVSEYATMHQWEDWAETFAHYLHIRDTLQTAAAYRVEVGGPAIPTADPAPLGSVPVDIDGVLAAWIPLTYALNAINRSMGAPDVYPFVIAPKVKIKLAFIDSLIRRRGN